MVSPKDLGWQIVSFELQNTILPDRTREFINPLILYQLHFCPMRFLRKTTPGFIINGELLSGSLPQESFEKFIDEALATTPKEQVAAR